MVFHFFNNLFGEMFESFLLMNFNIFNQPGQYLPIFLTIFLNFPNVRVFLVNQ